MAKPKETTAALGKIRQLWTISDKRTKEIIHNPYTIKNIIPYLMILISDGWQTRSSQ